MPFWNCPKPLTILQLIKLFARDFCFLWLFFGLSGNWVFNMKKMQSLWLVMFFWVLQIHLKIQKKEKSKLDPFWTRIRYWIRSIRGSGSGSCKIGPADPDSDPYQENGSGSESTWTRSRSDPLPSLVVHLLNPCSSVFS